MSTDEGPRWWPVAGETDLAPGEVMVVGAEGRSFALGRTADGRFGAIDNVCTHDGGTLGEGELDEHCVECPRHGARFDIRSGAATQLPAFEPVETHAVRIEGDAIQISVGHQ